jgi:2-desacetyl-2-hydroxyethyl bacteriochlorophyllide A dehydrogenase
MSGDELSHGRTIGEKEDMRRSLYFVGPGEVEVREEEIPEPRGQEILIRTLMSAISAGTEMLFFHDMVERGAPLDTNIGCLNQRFNYPFKYGYSSVGEVVSVGPNVPRFWEGQLMFSFHPHESHYVCDLEEAIPVPDDLSPENALYLPSMETAISLVMDGRPLLGERVLVLGQGVIGLLTTSLLSMMPLSSLVTLDRYGMRREASLEMGAEMSMEADTPITDLLEDSGLGEEKADLTYELSGNPEALSYALQATGFEGRIVVGSWYGKKRAELEMGEVFHRNRLRIISSQVSNIAPSLTGRWNKRRRLSLGWEMVGRVAPSKLITHRLNIRNAQAAYEMIDGQKDRLMQVVFTYD